MSGLELLSSLLKVAAVFALLYVTLRALAKHQGHKASGSRSVSRASRKVAEPLLEVLEQSTIGRSAKVVTVRVGERILLLGVTEGEISTLADVSDDVDLTVYDSGEGDPERVLDHALDILRSGSLRR